MRLLLALLLSCPATLAVPITVRAEVDSRPPAVRYAELAARAEQAFAVSGSVGAIRAYEAALAEMPDLAGRIHLRLGQLHHQMGQGPDAAFHFRKCEQDAGVDATDKDLICHEGFLALTAAMNIIGLPEDAATHVVEPTSFAGPFATGQRLPLGTARLEVTTSNGSRSEWRVRVVRPETTWNVQLAPMIADLEEDTSEGSFEGSGADTGAGKWPAAASFGVGLLATGVGLYLGFDNRAKLEDTRSRQASGHCQASGCQGELDDAEARATVSDALWIGGAGLSSVGVALWFVLE